VATIKDKSESINARLDADDVAERRAANANSTEMISRAVASKPGSDGLADGDEVFAHLQDGN